MDIYRIVTQERTWDFNRGMKNELDEKKDRGNGPFFNDLFVIYI